MRGKKWSGAFLVAIASIFCAIAAFAIPHGGSNVDDDPAMARFLYPDVLRNYFDEKGAAFALRTPTLDRMEKGEAFASGEPGALARATTHEELIAFIDALPDDHLRVLYLGTFPSYAKGADALSFDLPALIFSKPVCYDASALSSLGKPIVYVQAQIHGDEPSGCDALLAVAADLARDEAGILDKISVILLPRFNVDGAWRNRRETGLPGGGEVDANRDATAALSPLTRAVRNLLVTYRPHVFVDLHEMGFEYWGGAEFTVDGEPTEGYRYYFDFDLATLVAHPANAPRGVTTLSRELEAGVSRDLASSGLRTARYAYPAEVPDYRTERVDGIEVLRPDGTTAPGYATHPAALMEGMPDECIFDSAASLAPSVALLFEARSPGVLTNFRTRVRAHYEAVSSVLRQVAACPEIFLEAARSDARAWDDIVLWARQAVRRDVSISALELDDRKTAVRERTLSIEVVYGNEGLSPVKTVSRPHAYLISADAREADAIASRLALTGAEIYRLTEAAIATTEAYTVRRIAHRSDEVLGYAARSGDYFSPWSALSHAVDEVEVSKKNFVFPAGTYLFYAADNFATLAALAVEPMANRNLGNYWIAQNRAGERANGLIPAEVDESYPVYRATEKKFFPSARAWSEAPVLRGAYVEEVVPFDVRAVSVDCAFGYRFFARHPAGGVPDFFELTLPLERDGKKLRQWHLFDWTTWTYLPVAAHIENGVAAIRVEREHISPDGEVLAIAVTISENP